MSTDDEDAAELGLDASPAELMARLEARSYKTYNARREASTRLESRGRAWNTALVALATASTTASIGMLSDAEMYGAQRDTLMACVAILSLVASLVVANMDYSGRSRDMFVNYRKIQALSVEAESAKTNADLTLAGVREVQQRYDRYLDESDNHSTADHDRAAGNAKSSAVRRARCLTLLPYASLILPALLVFPLIGALAWW